MLHLIWARWMYVCSEFRFRLSCVCFRCGGGRSASPLTLSEDTTQTVTQSPAALGDFVPPRFNQYRYQRSRCPRIRWSSDDQDCYKSLKLLGCWAERWVLSKKWKASSNLGSPLVLNVNHATVFLGGYWRFWDCFAWDWFCFWNLSSVGTLNTVNCGPMLFASS